MDGRISKKEVLMKVAIVTTRHGAQDDRIYYKQALSLASRMDVTMIAPEDGENLDWHPDVLFHPIPRRLSPIGRLWSLVEAVSAIRRENPDFCHLHDLDLALAIPFIRFLTRAKIVYDSHEAFPEQILMNQRIPKMFRPLSAKIVDMLEKWLVHFADHVVTADNPTCASFEESHIPSTTVFNYPPLNIFDTVNARLQKERENYSCRFPIIYQGSTSADRGLFHMIDALAIIKKSEPRILLRIVGLGSLKLKNEALACAEANGVLDLLEIVGWVSHLDIAYSMKSSLIGLVPWQPEEKHKRNIPIKIFEYMACGLPIIAADLPSIAYYLSRVEAGILYDSTHPEQLARSVLDLLAAPERRGIMGENGIHAVHERWNWNEMEKVLFQVYESLGAHWKRNIKECSVST